MGWGPKKIKTHKADKASRNLWFVVRISVCPSTVILCPLLSTSFPSRPPTDLPAATTLPLTFAHHITANHVRYRVCHRERRRRCVSDDPHGSRPDQEGRVSLVFVGRGGLGAGCAFFSPNALIRGRQTVDVFSLFQVFRCRAFSLLRTKSSSLLTAIVSSLAPGSIFSHPVVQRRL